MKIILCEPQCWGFEHALFNAALLETVLRAYPEAQVFFLGEQGHLKQVRSYLNQTLGASVTWQSISIPEPDYDHWGHFSLAGYRKEETWHHQVRLYAAEKQADLVIITSITAAGLLVTKLTMLRRPSSVPTIVIPHGILALLVTRVRNPRVIIKNFLFGFPRILRLPHPNKLRYIALGGSILQTLHEISPRLAAHFRPLDPPYLWSRDQSTLQPPKDQVIRFGYFGVGFKGFDQFAQLAAELKPSHPQAEFILVGFLNTPQDPSTYQGHVVGVSTEPLSDEEFARRADSLTYAVWIARDPTHYRLTASVTFLDALSYGKPGIYLKTPYTDYYFQKLGDIGYLCDTYEDMRAVMQSILTDFPKERYQQQCQNILAQRYIFEPATLAAQFRTIGDELLNQ
jgi:glycosyltransferase involved in cell wall biosynthesis